MNNDITGLRNVLFETLRGVKDGTIPLDRAKIINETAQVITNTAKAEVDFMKTAGLKNALSNFMGGLEVTGAVMTSTGEKITRVDPADGLRTTTHRLRG